MKHRAIATMIGLIGLTGCAWAGAAPPAKPAQPAQGPALEVVVKYGGSTGRATTATGIHMVFEGKALPSGDFATFLINNANEKKKTYGPLPTLAGAMAQFKAGDLIDIVCTPPRNGNGPIPIQSLKPYKAKPGEDDPNGYVFVETFTHKTGDLTDYEITLSRYLQKTTFKVPTYRDASGNLVPDDVIEGIAGNLKPGQVVYATHIGMDDDVTIKLLASWSNHFTGKFVKLDPSATIDTNNTLGPAVDLIGPKGAPIAALIPGTFLGTKWTPNPVILASLRSLKPDAEVDCLTANSGDKRIWLITIKPSKPTAAGTAMSRDTH